VEVRDDLDAGAAQAAAVDEARVVELVGDDEIAALGKALEETDVGGVAAREEDAGGLPEVGGEGLLELDVGALGAADEARGTGADAVGLEVETDGVEE